MHCSGALDDSIPCPYYQNTYPVCFADGICGEWLNKVADILEKHGEVSHFFEMEIEQANERMESPHNPMFNGVEVGNDKRIELNKAHVRFCEQILKMIGGLKECGNFAGEKKGTFFLVIQFSTYTLYFKAYINFTFQEYPIRCLPIRNGCLFVRTPMPTRFQASYYPLGEKGVLGK